MIQRRFAGIALGAILAAAASMTTVGCTARQDGAPVLSEQDIGDLEFAGGIAAGEVCHFAADKLEDGQVGLMRVAVAAAIITVEEGGVAAIAEALEPIKVIDPLRAQEIAGIVDRLMRRIPPGEAADTAKRIVLTVLRGCQVGLGDDIATLLRIRDLMPLAAHGHRERLSRTRGGDA